MTVKAHIFHVLKWFHQYLAGALKDTPKTYTENPMRLEPRTAGLHVKHLITEPRRTPSSHPVNGDSHCFNNHGYHLTHNASP